MSFTHGNAYNLQHVVTKPLSRASILALQPLFYCVIKTGKQEAARQIHVCKVILREDLETATMQSAIILFCSIFSYAIFCFGAQEYSNRWTVQIDGDKHETDRLAKKHGFVNLRKVSFSF